ncbi:MULTISPECIES: hypothetical protein [Bosea]|jgi:hypothetical protein|uniref:hypothetical protein n=1 Tax=Bosea TaxID=85413 RepID=UPI00214F8CE2|nr:MULTISPECIES: hypothetical protein [Bosea]MCR4523168.1 hypothetical protein [Bosea sp. 47.2.35]MDR6830159.1 hypothetical protein [Bosea robiniae]MDR6895491.1 hypothetical protein [Bosea sp. BE109]MDR7138887.1 hypothetical protein [Bosea sp. BE168]MDR7175588.1 hypothetical protein [Bosea sp. BE271]
MSDAISLATSIVTMQAASTQQALSIEMLKQNAQAEQGLLAMLQQSVEQTQATLPAGQGTLVDRTA